ncbi:glutathione S-transferase [Xylaria castorea]|nr:glutathione S-transferase [Xylaria castorea]
MSQVTLYYGKGSCALAPHAVLRHIGIPFKAVEMLFRPGESGLQASDGSLSNAEFRKINPAGYVPVLVVDGEPVTEQFAVIIMAASLSPDKEAGAALLGRDQLDRVRVAQWMAWISDTLHSSGYGAHLHPERYVEDNKDMYDAVKAKGLKTIKYSYDLIEKRLGERAYAVGQYLTVVDFFLYVVWTWGTPLAHIDMKIYPAYEKLVRRMEALDGVKKAVEAEGLNLWLE